MCSLRPLALGIRTYMPNSTKVAKGSYNIKTFNISERKDEDFRTICWTSPSQKLVWHQYQHKSLNFKMGQKAYN